MPDFGPNVVNKTTTSVVQQYSLVRPNEGNAEAVDVPATANIPPVGIALDGATASGKTIRVAYLGIMDGTTQAIASNTITPGSLLFAAASGKVQPMPANPGTYYQVGIALSGATAAGDLVTLTTCAPRRVVIVDEP